MHCIVLICKLSSFCLLCFDAGSCTTEGHSAAAICKGSVPPWGPGQTFTATKVAAAIRCTHETRHIAQTS